MAEKPVCLLVIRHGTAEAISETSSTHENLDEFGKKVVNSNE